MKQPQVSASTTEEIALHALGKTWGRLVRRRYLEVKHYNGQRAYIDLFATAEQGRSIVLCSLPQPEAK